jgi:mannosyl-oligosaccharide alpha-1,2-mannosidase
MPTGIMPETLEVSPCAEIENCPWDEGKWYEDVLGQPIHSREHLERAQKQVEDEGLPPGIVGIADPTYKLRYDLDSTFPVAVPIWSVILTTSLGPRLSSPSS